MSRIGRVLLVLPLLGLGAVATTVIRSAPSAMQQPEGDERSLGAIPTLPFVRNAGQVDPGVAYHLPGSQVGFTAGGLQLGLESGTAELSLVGAGGAGPVGLGRTPTAVSYFRGPQTQWHTGLPTFDRIGYPDAWPGIDARFRDGVDRLKYGFVVSPGADPSRIALSYGPGSSLRLDEDGNLHVVTSAGSVVDAAPTAYQLTSGQRVPVEVRYEVSGDRYGFDLGAFDRTRPLVIDPAIVYSGFIGGSGYEGGYGIAVDDEGAAYVTGYTESSDFPATSYDTTLGDAQDAFVAKVKPDGSGFVYVALLGGTGNDDYGERIVVDGAGNAYITGQANSNDFPTKVGPDLDFNGIDDGIIVKLNPTGTDLVFSGYIGGADDDYTYGIALGADGSVFVSGTTKSDDFPATVLDTTQQGLRDAFFAKVRPDGTGLEFAGLLGGSENNRTTRGHGIQLAPGGDFYLAGETNSETLVGTSAFDTSYNGTNDAFLARIAGDGTAIRSLGFIGGTEGDFLNDLATDPQGNAYLAGHTSSADFPVAVGPDLTHNGPASNPDAFITKVDPSGMTLLYSGYIGGSIDQDYGNGIGVDPTGAAYLVGRTYSSDFPTVDGPDTSYNDPGPDANNDGDGFVAKVDPTGASLVYSSFLGGTDEDVAYGMALDPGGNAFVTGETYSNDFPAAVGPDTTWNGAPGVTDAFVTKIETTERCKGKPVTHLGSAGSDSITGNARPNVVLAGAGKDTVKTLGGADVVCAGDGNDKVKAGAGSKDISLGEKGNDRLNGGAGSKDKSVGGPGRDKLNGGPGKKDACKGGPGKDDASENACEKGKA